jgi:hypothetical protein
LISPTQKNVADGSFTLTVTGAAFISGVSTVRLNGGNRTTSFINSNSLQATIPASDLTAAGAFPITVFNASPGGGSSAPATLFVGTANPSPTISSLTPSSASAGATGQTVLITGTNFVAASQALFASSARTTTYLSATQLNVEVTTADLAAAGLFPVIVVNPAPGGGTSSASNFTVNAPGLVPTITHVQPISANAHATNTVVIAIDGANFITSVTQGKWNGSNRSTNVLSQTQILLTTNAGDIAAAGTATLTLTNPGGTSNSRSFYIVGAADNLVPVINSLVPSSKNVGDVGFTLQVNGKGFYSGSVVKINGASRTTAFVNSTRVDATILTADLAAVGNQAITVFNTTPGGGTSDPVYLAVLGTTNPAPTITDLTPSAIARGSGDTAVTVDGLNFLPTSVVRLNGTDQTTTYVSSTQVSLTVASADVAVSPGALARLNPRAHLTTETVGATALRAFQAGTAEQPALSIGPLELRTGLFSPEPGVLAVAVDGVEVKRWDGPESAAAADDLLTWLGL